MREINVSDEVWQAIAERGKFGETEDDVLSRVFNLPKPPDSSGTVRRGGNSARPNRTRQRVHRATKRMSAYIQDNDLVVRFETGEENNWGLPNRNDKAGIRKVRDIQLYSSPKVTVPHWDNRMQ